MVAWRGCFRGPNGDCHRQRSGSCLLFMETVLVLMAPRTRNSKPVNAIIRAVPIRCQKRGPEKAKSLKCRVSSVVEQRFCKPLVGSSNLSPGTNKIKCLAQIRIGLHVAYV